MRLHLGISFLIALLLVGCNTTHQSPIAKNYLYKKSNGENIWSETAITHPDYHLLSPLTDRYHVSKKSAHSPIEATYFIGHTDHHFVKLTFASGFQQILPQTHAWSRGAHYAIDDFEWISEGNRATLIRKGEKHSFNRIPSSH